jgi:hypothetical protein
VACHLEAAGQRELAAVGIGAASRTFPVGAAARKKSFSNLCGRRVSRQPLSVIPTARHNEGDPVIVLGVILLIIGFIVGIHILWTIGIVLLVVGVILAVLGGTGRKVGGRAHWF